MNKIGRFILASCIVFFLWVVLFLTFMNIFSYRIFGPSAGVQSSDPYFIGSIRDLILAPYEVPAVMISTSTDVITILFVSSLFFFLGPYFWIVVFAILYSVREHRLKKR